MLKELLEDSTYLSPGEIKFIEVSSSNYTSY
jgi:hypothetical protein